MTPEEFEEYTDLNNKILLGVVLANEAIRFNELDIMFSKLDPKAKVALKLERRRNEIK